jgi:hypothetical protein
LNRIYALLKKYQRGLQRADPIVDRLSGRLLGSGDFEGIAGPAANE